MHLHGLGQYANSAAAFQGYQAEVVKSQNTIHGGQYKSFRCALDTSTLLLSLSDSLHAVGPWPLEKLWFRDFGKFYSVNYIINFYGRALPKIMSGVARDNTYWTDPERLGNPILALR